MPAPALGLPRARWKGWGGCKSGAGRVRGSREPPEGEELLVRGSPAATALEHPFLGLWPSGCLFRLQGPGPVLGPAGGASRIRELLFLAGAEGERGLFIDQTIRAPCVNGTPRASRAQTFQAPPLAPPPRAPRPRAYPWPPPAGTAPPPAPLYGQSSPGRVRQWRPRPSPCVTERLRAGSGAAGSPSGGGCESWGSVQDRGSARGTGLRLGAPVLGTGSRSQPGR